MSFPIIITVVFFLIFVAIVVYYYKKYETFGVFELDEMKMVEDSGNIEFKDTNDNSLFKINSNNEIETEKLITDNITLGDMEADSLDFNNNELQTNGIEAVGDFIINSENTIIEGNLNSQNLEVDGDMNLQSLKIGNFSMSQDTENGTLKFASDNSDSTTNVRMTSSTLVDGSTINTSSLNINNNDGKMQFANDLTSSNFDTNELEASTTLAVTGNISNVESIISPKLNVTGSSDLNISDITNSTVTLNGNLDNENLNITSNTSILGSGSENNTNYLNTNIIKVKNSGPIQVLSEMNMNNKNLYINKDQNNDESDVVLTTNSATIEGNINVDQLCVGDNCVTVDEITGLKERNNTNTRTMNIIESKPYKILGCYKIGKNRSGTSLIANDPSEKMSVEECSKACPPTKYDIFAFNKGFCSCGTIDDMPDPLDQTHLEKCRRGKGSLQGKKKKILVYGYKSKTA